MSKKVSKEQSTAEGHVCMINRFDTETVMVPFREQELSLLHNLLKRRIGILEASEDYPEKERDTQTLNNLMMGMWMLSVKLDNVPSGSTVHAVGCSCEHCKIGFTKA